MGNPDALAGARARVEEDRASRRGAAETGPSAAWGQLGTEPSPWPLSRRERGLGSEELRYAAWVLRELVLPPELRGARAHGLTVRTPYLDPRFANLALALPSKSVLVREGTGKWLFRHAVRALVPTGDPPRAQDPALRAHRAVQPRPRPLAGALPRLALALPPGAPGGHRLHRHRSRCWTATPVCLPTLRTPAAWTGC